MVAGWRGGRGRGVCIRFSRRLWKREHTLVVDSPTTQQAGTRSTSSRGLQRDGGSNFILRERDSWEGFCSCIGAK